MGTVTRRWRRATAALALAASMAATAGCGARWNDDQRAAVLARDDQPTAVAAGTTASASPTTTTTTTAAAGVSDPAATASGGGAGSSTPTSAGPDPAGGGGSADSGPATAAETGARPCDAPSDAPGVTGDQIAVGSISSLSGPVPGLGASAAAAVRAYVAYRNASGGICGRRLVLKEADDGTDTGRYRSVVSQLVPDVLGIAGGFALGDVGGTEVVADNGLPVVNVPSGDAVTALPTAFDINPPYDNPDAVIGKYRYLRDHGASKVAMVYLAVDQSRAEARVQRRLMEAAGLQIAQVQELPVATLNYDAAARKVANSGADYLFFIGDERSNGSMAVSMHNTGYHLKFAEYFTFSYGADFIDLAGADAAEGATSWIRTLPNEEAGTNAEMAKFVEWMGRVSPGDVKDVFAADSWAGAKAFFDSLQSLPGPISRKALVAQLAGVDTYDAGGMLGPIRLGAERTNGCFIAMQVRSGTWVRLAPATGFLC